MKKFNLIIASLIVAVGFAACSKDDTEYYDPQKYFTLEASAIEDYADSVASAMGKEAVWDSTGIWYILEEEGLQDSTADGFYKYNINNANQIEVPRISVKYSGRLINTGAAFATDQTMNNQSLVNLIQGWHFAFLPKFIEDKKGVMQRNYLSIDILELGLQKGSKVRIFLPSPFGYANSTQPNIPANSPLDFHIEVLEVKPPAP